jgi:hypothetical protein
MNGLIVDSKIISSEELTGKTSHSFPFSSSNAFTSTSAFTVNSNVSGISLLFVGL